jgi:hypothetical protein
VVELNLADYSVSDGA